jgi:hypothetical protein
MVNERHTIPNLEPTMNLRFVDREVSEPVKTDPAFHHVFNVRILQQLWVDKESFWGGDYRFKEWRDVSLQSEDE